MGGKKGRKGKTKKKKRGGEGQGQEKKYKGCWEWKDGPSVVGRRGREGEGSLRAVCTVQWERAARSE